MGVYQSIALYVLRLYNKGEEYEKDDDDNGTIDSSDKLSFSICSRREENGQGRE